MVFYLNTSCIDFEMVDALSLILERKDKPCKSQAEIDLDNEAENILTEIT